MQGIASRDDGFPLFSVAVQRQCRERGEGQRSRERELPEWRGADRNVAQMIIIPHDGGHTPAFPNRHFKYPPFICLSTVYLLVDGLVARSVVFWFELGEHRLALIFSQRSQS